MAVGSVSYLEQCGWVGGWMDEYEELIKLVGLDNRQAVTFPEGNCL